MNTLEQERQALRRLPDGTAARTDVAPLIRRGTRLLLAGLWSFAVVAIVVSCIVLFSHAKSHTQATTISLEQYIQRNVALAAFVADEYKEFLDQRGGVESLANDAAARKKLQSLNKWLPEGSASLVVLPDGSAAVSTDPLPSTALDFSDRRWFKAHVEEGVDTYIGPAVRSRVNDRYIYTYTASYKSADGQILAIIDLGIPSDSLTGLTRDQHGTDLALVQHEGPVVAAEPFSPALLNGPLRLPGKAPQSQETVLGPVFGSYGVVTIRNLPEFHLYTLVAVPLLTAMEPLLWGAAIGLTLLGLLTQLLLGLSGLLQTKSREVEQALADNKVLFQEVHHRVKNNLQVISSLLRLQTERLPPDIRPLMEETGARVRAIALVHEQIYRTASPSVIQLDAFLAQLVQQLAASMIGGRARISTDLAPVSIGLDRAVPVAILATEAITNAIKHGLEQGQGTIALALRSEDGRNIIEVRDSGNGPPEEGKSGLGTRIMTALSRQIDGTWDLRSAPSGGTLFTLSWPEGS